MNKPKSLLIGQSDFKALRDAGAYYVDKSLFIQEVVEASAQVLLLPRPRRFGKTLNLSMLAYFFEHGETAHCALFEGLAIYDTPTFAQHQGQYPVIHLTFKDAKHHRWAGCLAHLKRALYQVYARHRYLLDSERLFAEEKGYIQRVIDGSASEIDDEQALERLSAYLARHHDRQVVILIDEYDTPIQSGYIDGYYEEVVGFMRNLLSGGLKDNKYLFKGVLTGILRVAKESIFSGLNNLRVYTLLTGEFNTAFGFTEAETQHVLSDYGASGQYDAVAFWYNGYIFGGRVIYNPWSVLNYVASQDRQLRPYWVNTASPDLIDQLVTRGGRELRQELAQLLEGQAITQPVYDNIVMRDLERRDNLLWSFLLFSGYLKAVRQVAEEQYALQIPNYEVARIYRDLVKRWFEEKVTQPRLEAMLAALERGDVDVFERMLRLIVREVMSYHDLSGEPEKVYQALVLGMLVWLSEKYDIRTNRESGYGRYDMLLKPKSPHQQGIIMEFKRVYEDASPETVLDAALRQIEERQYATELESAGVRDILRLAVAFRGKELWVRASRVL